VNLRPAAARFGPALVTLGCLAVLALAVIASAGGDPLTLAQIGTRFSQGDPQGSLGYDGQFIYYIARDPAPQRVAPLLDEPAYRYQRILLPLLARLLALGSPDRIPWTILLVGLLAQTAGAFLVGELLAGWGVSRWYALVYGLGAGFALAVRLDLPEPLAYALAAGGLLAAQRGRPRAAAALLGLALFAKEVAILFVVPLWIEQVFGQRWKEAGWTALIGLVPYTMFQGWLWLVFGRPGLGSGGWMATPFEVIPFMGLVRIFEVSPAYFVAMLVVFGPAVVLPAAWLWVAATRRMLRPEINVVVLGAWFNALAVAGMPFSTFRETGGVLRFACGLTLALLLYAARYKYRRVLNYTPLWLVLNMFFFKA
jgi:hypothetical protein